MIRFATDNITIGSAVIDQFDVAVLRINRIDGPSYFCRTHKLWFSMGKYHRLNGPFYILFRNKYYNQYENWARHDVRFSEDQIEQWFTEKGIDPLDMSDIEELIFVGEFPW